MSVLKETTADGLKVLRAASAATDVMRKGEVDALLATRPTTSEMTAALAVANHAAVTTQNSASLALSVSGQELIGSVRLATDSGLCIDPDGLTVDFGAGAAQVAAGNHTHANDHIAATGGTTTSSVVTVTDQVISVAVTVDPSGYIEAGASGLKIADSSFAAYGHTHPVASAVVAGFMSAADKVALDNLVGTTANSLADSATIEWAIGSSQSTPSVKLGAGITTDAVGLAVDFADVAAADHTHGSSTPLAAGFMSAAQYDLLDAATYTYLGYATDVIGGSSVQSFSTTVSSEKLWEAVKVSDIPIAAPSAADFAGLWKLRLTSQQATVGSSNGTLASTTVLANQLRAALIALGLIEA